MRRFLLLVFGAVLFLGVAPGVAGASSAGEPPTRSTAEVAPTAAPAGCTATNVCFWVHANFVDGPGRLSGTNPDWRAFGHASCGGGTWNNCASSVYNNGSRCWADLWDGFNYTLGARGSLSLNRGVGITNLVPWDFDNAISSNSWSRCV